MKTLIIYFSQTGFTRKVAEQIRDGVAEVAGHCDLATLTDVKPESLAGYDLVGLGCPVFYYNAPFNVRDFMQGLPELADKQWFVFCSHGSVMGNTLILMAEALKKKGIRVVGYHDTYADGTLPFYPYPTLTTGHPDELEYEEARAFGREVAERSRRIAAGEQGLIPEAGEKNQEWTQQADTFSLDVLSQIMPRMSINEEKCVHCQECVGELPGGRDRCRRQTLHASRTRASTAGTARRSARSLPSRRTGTAWFPLHRRTMPAIGKCSKRRRPGESSDG